jgi:outer membrane protein assembly factor BamA
MLVLLLNFFSLLFSPDSIGHVMNNSAEDSVKRHRRIEKADTLRIGKFLNVNRIFIIGNRITRDPVILRELSLKQGDVVFSADMTDILDLDRKKLLNTRLFNTVEIRTIEIEPMKIDLIIEVNERWYTFPAPIFELADRNFNEWWQNYNHDLKRVNYGLRLYQYNVRGRNETLRLHGQLGFQRRFELMYKVPYIDKTQKHGLTFDFTFFETKNLAYKTEDHKYEFLKADDILRTNRFGSVTYTYRNSFYQTHSLKLEYYNTFFDDTVKLLNPLYYKDEQTSQSYASVTYGFTSDHRDFIAYPLKGHLFSAYATKNGLLPEDQLNRYEATLNFSKYFTLKKNYYISNNLVLYGSDPADLSYLNYGVLGLKRQFVRGYEVYVIEGPFFFLNKTTFKKLLFSRKYHWSGMPIEQFRHIPLSIYLKSYADFGYVINYDDYEKLHLNEKLTDKLLKGAGMGLDIVGSYDVVIRVEYTFNAEGEQGFFFHLRREF